MGIWWPSSHNHGRSVGGMGGMGGAVAGSVGGGGSFGWLRTGGHMP